MISLRGVKVILVDDSLEESLPVIKAFAKKGIPVAYFDGSISDLPVGDEKLKGVRLAILDMDLGGAGDNNENKVSALIARLQAIFALDNGPYTMIAWTKHSDLVDLLEAKLFTLYRTKDSPDKVPLPVVCIKLEKNEFKTRDGNFDIEKLSARVEAELSRSTPLTIMQSWEEKCFRAASGVTTGISELIAVPGDSLAAWREKWNTAYLEVLLQLANEEIGKDNLTSTTFLDALFSSLNPLHIDILETDQLPLPTLPEKIISDHVKDDKEPNPLAGKINTKLHLTFENIGQFRPGNIYKLADCGGVFPVDPRIIFDDLVQPDLKDKEDVFTKVTPVLLEVSASCDYAQNKIKMAKFVAGLLIPLSEIKKFKIPKESQGTLLPLGLFWVDEKDCFILLSSQHAVSSGLRDAKERLHAFARLRSQGLTHVQFWMAQQISRPGVMMLR